MTPANTELPDIPALGETVACLEAVTLVLNYPGCTVGELVARTEAGQDEQQREVARLALLPALHQGVERGHLVTGPRRECRERRIETTTWMPGDQYNTPVMMPRGLASKIRRAIEEAKA